MVTSNDSDMVIRRLYQITSDYQKGFDIQVYQLLMMGLERFELDIGILSRISAGTYTVVHCVAPEEIPLNTGDNFSIKSTYCEITCQTLGPVAIENIAANPKFSQHPAFATFGLKSYVGIPIFVDDELYGTLSFSSPNVYERPFRDADIDVLKLMASWIEVEMIRRRQETQLHLLNERLERQAFYDELTGLANRRHLFNILQRDVTRIGYNSGKGTLAVLDLDHFKRVNDQYGHQIGDELLKQFAVVVQTQLASGALVARFGGEEFVIWLPHMDGAQAAALLNQVNQAVKAIRLNDLKVTVSIGACWFDLALLTSEDQAQFNSDKLISSADQQLYYAKKNGRDQVALVGYPGLETPVSG